MLGHVDVGVAVDLGGILLQSTLEGGDSLQLLIFHLDQVQGVLHQVGRLSGYHGDGVAVTADLVVHQAGLILKDDAEAVLAGDGGVVQHAGHAGQGPGLLQIQLFDVGVGNGAAEHAAVEHVGHLVVGGELGGAQHLFQRVDLYVVMGENSVILHAYASPLFFSAASSTAATILA